MSKLETNFNLDIALAILYLLIMEPKFTGLVLHEWVGLILGIIFIIHVVMHWQWVLEVTKRYFKKFPKKAKVNYALDILLTLGSFGIILSGMAISKKIGFAWLGIGGDIKMWQHLHVAFSFLTLLVIAIHVGLHWKWAINAFKKIGQHELKNFTKPLKGMLIILIVVFGIYSFGYIDYFNTVKNNLVLNEDYFHQTQNNTSTGNSLIINSIENVNTNSNGGNSDGSKVKGSRGGGGGGRGSGSGYSSNITTTDSTSILGYFGVSIFVILIVYYLEILVNKFSRRKRILLN